MAQYIECIFLTLLSLGSCECGQTIQTRQHILRECLKYLNQHSLLGMGRNAHLDRLVGTEKGIERLTKFITIMKAIDKRSTTITSADPHTINR